MQEASPFHFEWSYLDLVRTILTHGEIRADRTGVGTLSIFGPRLEIDLRDGFPLMTTKKMAWRAIVAELLWFIEGSGDERRLAEILHGTRSPEKKTIWSPNAEATSGSSFRPAYAGDLGRIYGVQWRSWQSMQLLDHRDSLSHDDGSTTLFNAKVNVTQVDQLKQLINKIKTSPTDRRLIISAWNPGELHRMALPPCHMMAQFYVSIERLGSRGLTCMMTQRSVDVGLGLPFNIASYALLTHIIASITGLRAERLILNLGDTHIYRNHVEKLRGQLNLVPRPLPQLELPDLSAVGIDGLDIDMVANSLKNYECLPAISLDMAA